ncbi:trehalose-phosphatase [soil metagenome]
MEQTLATFFKQMPYKRVHALLLDYDGTLAPFQDDPAQATPYSGIRSVLRRMQKRTQTRIILVSGRKAIEVKHLLGLDNIEIWGCHGMEHLPAAGTTEMLSLDAETRDALEGAREMFSQAGLAYFMEDKPTGHAVHWRGKPQLEAERIRDLAEDAWLRIPVNNRLRVLHFDGGLEVCAAIRNKGDVVRKIHDEIREPHSMAYLGDDVTDEDAFQALKGIGLSILVRDVYRETNADIWIRPPHDVLKFLERWIEACESRT